MERLEVLATSKKKSISINAQVKGLQVWLKVQHTLLCREISYVVSYTRDEGGSQKVTNDDEGEGEVTIPPKNYDIIYEQPLRHWLCLNICLSLDLFASTILAAISLVSANARN